MKINDIVILILNIGMGVFFITELYTHSTAFIETNYLLLFNQLIILFLAVAIKNANEYIKVLR